MVKVLAQSKKFECKRGANFRKVLLQNGIELYNGGAAVINRRGIGTCAVQVEGEIIEANWRDKTRRSLPPHSATKNLRLACQKQGAGTSCLFLFLTPDSFPQ